MFTTRSSTDLQQKTLLIKQDDKFFSRLLSRELSMNTKNNGSFRGLPSSVPFTWESQLGTPKHHFHSGTVQPLPPLTPPPSYYSTHSSIKRQTTSFRSNPIHTLFLKLNITKPKSTNHAAQPSSPSMSSYSSSSWSSSSSSTTPSCPSSRRRSRFGSWGGSMSSSCSSSSKVEEEEDDTGIVGSTMCFMIRRRSGSQKKGLMSSMGRASC
ncbi:unnamed protein product [Rhodiola kirilowii]